jgi:hypothetical protein
MEQWISAFLTISITSHVFKRVINIETTFPNSGHHWENLPLLIPIFIKHPPKVPILISTKLLSPFRDIIGKTFRGGVLKHPQKVPIPISTKLLSPIRDIIRKTFRGGVLKHPQKVPIPISTKLLPPIRTHFCKIFANFLWTLLADHNALVYISQYFKN